MKMNKTKVTVFTVVMLLSVCWMPVAAFCQFRFIDATIPAKLKAFAQPTAEVGPGFVVFDFDNDGWDDIYTAGGVVEDHLFRNMHDGTFMDVSDSSFQVHDKYSYTRGGSAFDFDNDGLTDLYICCQRKDILYKNMGNGVFKNVSRQAGIIAPLTENQSNCSTFGDFDGDGDNDLYVARWIEENRFIQEPGQPASGYAHRGYRELMYVNNGNGTFTESALPMHIDGDTGNTNIALLFDYDRDGDLDILVGNDFGVQLKPNIVFKNMLMETGEPTFVDVTKEIGMETHLFCMGIGPCDYNRDGKFDFYETNIGPQVLLENRGDHFVDVTAKTGVPNGFLFHDNSTMSVTWSAVFGDYDNDGWEDAMIVHGFEGVIPPWSSNEIDTTEFIRNIGSFFENVTDQVGVSLDLRGRGGVQFDYDHDGYQDLGFASMGRIAGGSQKSDFRLLHNVTPHTANAHWLEMKFTAKRTAKEGVGTIVDVWAGGIVHSRQVSTGGGFTSQNSLIQHVGLGEYAMADSIVVYWPCDKNRHRQIDRYYNVQADRMIAYEENTAVDGVASSSSSAQTIQLYPQPAHSELNVTNIKAAAQANYEVYNLLGVRVLSGFSNENSMKLSLSDLKNGVYTLRIISGNDVVTKQFIKQ